MVAKKQPLTVKSSGTKKEKNKFNKNNSFSGVELKKSPKSRRKSIAAVLPTPLKKTKKEKNLNEWIVSENSNEDTTVKRQTRQQLVIADGTDEEDEKISIVSLKTPKSKVKKSRISILARKEKTPLKKSVQSPRIKVLTPNDKEQQTKAAVEESRSTEIDESEVKFGIEAKNIAQAVKAIIKLRSENPKLQNQLINDQIPVFLQVNCHKVPVGPPRVIRIPLPNSLLTPDHEVCIIVPDVKGVQNKEHEKHIEHYENLLRTKGVENIKRIMTFHEFRTEYETFEQKHRLVDLYDAFLVDGKISGKVVKKCGKIFYNKRKLPTPVKLQATKLKEHIDKALSKAYFHLHMKGDSYIVQFGHDKISTQDLVDNAFAVIEGLDKEFPGGFQNIKGIQVFTARATSIPIYASFKNPKEVTNPKVKAKKTKVFKTYTGELTTKLNTEVTVKPTGEVIVNRTKGGKDKEGEAENKEGNTSTESKKSKKRKLAQTDSSEDTKKTQDGKSNKRKKIEAVDNNEISLKANSSDKVVKKKKQNKNKQEKTTLKENNVTEGANKMKKIKKQAQGETVSTDAKPSKGNKNKQVDGVKQLKKKIKSPQTVTEKVEAISKDILKKTKEAKKTEPKQTKVAKKLVKANLKPPVHKTKKQKNIR